MCRLSDFDNQAAVSDDDERVDEFEDDQEINCDY